MGSNVSGEVNVIIRGDANRLEICTKGPPAPFQPAQPQQPPPQNEPEHKRHIRSIFAKLSSRLDTGKTAKYLYEHRRMNRKEFEEIQELVNNHQSTRAAEVMLNLVISRNETFFHWFLESLLKTNQLDIYSCILQDCRKDVDHTSWIRDHYTYLLDNLDSVNSKLVDHLYQDQVIDQTEYGDIIAEQTPARQNKRLLSILERKSKQQIKLFFDALDKTHQSYIKNDIMPFAFIISNT